MALALAATDARRRLRIVPLLVLAAATVVNLAQTLRLDFPVAPSGLTPLTGAVLGAAFAVAASYVGRGVHPRIGRRTRAAAGLAAAAGAGALLAVPAAGFLKRHADGGAGDAAHVAQHLAADPRFRDGSNPVATTPAYIGPLAGDTLRHRLLAIPASESCAALARRAETQWLVVYGGPLGTKAPTRARSCLPTPVFDRSTIALYRPRR
jgi:MFS family permease